jgi:hypothetical protein
MVIALALRQELVYHLNALLLRRPHPSGATLASTFVAVFEQEGRRHHEPALVADWGEAVGLDRDELLFELEDVLDTVVAELDDDEEPWSAHRLIDLLAEEPLWPFTWGATGTELRVPPRPARGLPLPIVLRPALVAILDALELRLFERNQEQRSVHDGLPASTIAQVVDAALAAIGELREDRRDGRMAALVRARSDRPTLREALIRIQRWKLSVTFDASPDDDDGEWTLRVLERLYGIEWVTRAGT